MGERDDEMATQASVSSVDAGTLDTATAPTLTPSSTPTPTQTTPRLRTPSTTPRSRTPSMPASSAPRSRTPSMPASSASASTAPLPGASTATTIDSPLGALEHDEILRTRWFCVVVGAIAFAGGASAFVLPGDPAFSAVLLAAVATSFVAIAFLYKRTRDPIAFRRRATSLGWFVPAVCVTAAIPYFGAFSPVPIVLVLGIYFTGLGRSWRVSLAVYVVCAGMQLVVAGLVIAGARDTGIVQVGDLSARDQIIIQAIVQTVMAATLVTARMSRRTALIAAGELERAVRVAAHREALLLEAREELERALRQGRGRFSDQTIGGHHLGALLGRGAMGEVYEAQGPHGTVAIKLLSQASLSNPHHVLRFLRELRTAAAVRAPNIVHVIEVGEQPVPYLVMERLQGMTLGEMLRGRSGPMTGEEIVDVVEQVGAGITAAAAAGIVHRDLKPTNIYLDRGTWKILDFGVARAMDEGDTLTAGQVVGTPTYMAPEQATGGTVDHLTDLYALAAVAYRAITGHPPFAAGEIAETLYRVVHTRPRRPSDLADVPPAIDLVLAIGLARDPAQRFATATELAAALAAAFSGTLPEPLIQRGRVLDRAGAWADAQPRHATSPTRAAE